MKAIHEQWAKDVLTAAILAALASGAWFCRHQARHPHCQVEETSTAIAQLKTDHVSPLRLAAKMDVAEGFAGSRSRTKLILALLAGSVALAGAAGLAIWQRNKKAHYLALYESEAARRADEERHGIALRSIGDALVVTDLHGRVALLNPAAETLSGWKQADAQGRPVGEVLRIVNETSRQETANPVTRVLRDGVVAASADGSVLIARDGTERPVSSSAAPIRDSRNVLTGAVLVCQDRTAQCATQDALRHANRALRTISECDQAIARSTDETQLTHEVCRLLVEYGGYRMAWVGFAEDDEARTVRPVAHAGSGATYLAAAHISWGESERGHGPTGKAVRERRAVMTRDMRTDPEFAPWREAALSRGYLSSIALPLPMDDVHCLGVLNLYAPTPNAFDAQEVQLLTELANDLAHGICALRNRTARDRAEAALREGNELLRQTSAMARIGGWEFDPATGQGTWTDQVAIIHEVEPEQGTSAPFGLSFFHGESHRRIEQAVRDAVELGKDYDLELEMTTAKGNPIWVRTIGVPLMQDGRVVKVRGAIQDITASKQAEQALSDETVRWRVLFEQSSDGIVVLDHEGKVCEANRRYAEMLGYTPEELLQLHAWDWDAQWTREELHQMLGEIGAEGAHIETRHRRKDGTVFDVELSNNGAVCGGQKLMFCVCRDITERKRAEEEREKLQAQFLQAQKMESVGRLAGGVAHDFNNLLMGIMSYVELSKDELPPGHPVRPYLDEITSDARRSADLTRQLLAFARKQVIAPRILDINATVTGMLKLLHRLIGEDIDLVWTPGRDLWPVKLDPGQVDQLLANLCVNARDAIAGAGKVTIETRNVSLDAGHTIDVPDCVPGDYVVLAIGDSGCGMSEDTLSHVFEPFFTTKDVGKGTGLGLATVYGIVKQNNGFVSVQSEPNRGATFEVYLPRVHGDTDAGLKRKEPTASPRGDETVLLVEDEKTLRVTCRLLLEGLGYTVLSAETPAAALALTESHPGNIHLVLTDVVMPGMDGPHLAELLHADNPDLKCIFMSGYTADAIAYSGAQDKATQFLPKPFSRDDLAHKIRRALEDG